MPSRCLVCNLCLSPMQAHPSKRTLSEATAKAQRRHSEATPSLRGNPTDPRRKEQHGTAVCKQYRKTRPKYQPLNTHDGRMSPPSRYSATALQFKKGYSIPPVFICKTICIFNSAFAHSGRKLAHPIPRALPPSICFWPFRPSVGHRWMIHFDNRITGNRTVTL